MLQMYSPLEGGHQKTRFSDQPWYNSQYKAARKICLQSKTDTMLEVQTLILLRVFLTSECRHPGTWLAYEFCTVSFFKNKINIAGVYFCTSFHAPTASHQIETYSKLITL